MTNASTYAYIFSELYLFVRVCNINCKVWTGFTLRFEDAGIYVTGYFASNEYKNIHLRYYDIMYRF